MKRPLNGDALWLFALALALGLVAFAGSVWKVYLLGLIP
jgi:hypothetical protein